MFRPQPLTRSLAAGLFALSALAAVAAHTPATAGSQGGGPDRLVTVVTAAEPQTQLMAMVLSMQAAQQGAAVDMLLCGPGGDLALKQPPESAVAPQAAKGVSPQGLMQRLIAKGATVSVCAIYLPNRQADGSVLLDGVGVAEPGPMAAKLMARRTRVLSF